MTDIKTESKLNIPRVLIAAPGSGSGKTLVTCGLLKCLTKRGLDIRSYKCGPDYIDPMFHKKVLNIDSENLDPFFSDESYLKHILSKKGKGHALIEGVMGLYDGISPVDDKASAYDVAHLTDTPVILLIDAKGVGRTIISLIKGILFDDRYSLIKGVILNRVSRAYFEKLKPCIEEELKKAGFEDVYCLGCVPKIKDINIESRYLGLKLPDEIKDINRQIEKVSDALNENCDIDMLIKLMDKARPVSVDDVKIPVSGIGEKEIILAVAYDEAFCFYYKENLDILRDMGIRIEFFSPLNDDHIPKGAAGLLLGGGYPELFLEKLSNNRSMLDSIRDVIKNGIPSLAECGGFMYLHKYVSDSEGKRFELAGLIDGECRYTGSLVRFGYLKIDSCKEDASLLAKSLVGMRGHEFHYFESTANGDSCRAVKPDGSRSWECMISGENNLWGFSHFYYGSHVNMIYEFYRRMREYADR